MRLLLARYYTDRGNAKYRYSNMRVTFDLGILCTAYNARSVLLTVFVLDNWLAKRYYREHPCI